MPLVDEWSSAEDTHEDFMAIAYLAAIRIFTTLSGAQCVMTSGMLWMLKWPADNWDSKY